MSTDVMLDLETLGVSEDCVVLSIGMVKFDPFNTNEPHSPEYYRINIDLQSEMGRTINPDTIDWWSKQSKEAQDEAFSEEDRITPDEMTVHLNRYTVGAGKIWAQGPLFDIDILQNLYKMLGKPVPWQFWQIRDSRTVCDMGDDSAKTGNTNAHNALADAYSQAVAVQSIYNQLGVKEKIRK